MTSGATQYIIWNQDCVEGMVQLDHDSIDLMVSSIPFGSLFTYSGKIEDIGNNQDGTDLEDSQFGLHMRFFCARLLEVMKPGRNVCIHIQQLLSWKNQHGYIGKRDFRGAVVNLFEKAGFEWKGEFVIPKNPQVIAQRLNLHSLQFITGKRDATDLAPAVNDYVMIFQKPGENAVPVPALKDPLDNPRGWVTTEEWINWASGVWDNIRETDVLEGWKSARESDQEKHVCPLQLEVPRRLIRLYTNPGETVLDPFMGIGTTGYVALEQGRVTVGYELKESYHKQAIANCAKILADRDLSEDLFPEV
jgi:DNA modification methylase